jgi:hypothetical protein
MELDTSKDLLLNSIRRGFDFQRAPRPIPAISHRSDDCLTSTGGATMEAELVDSMTGKQIGAVMESGKGSRIPFSNLGDWTAAKGVMDGWAARFQKRLEEAR